MTVTVRPAQPRDAPHVERILTSSWGATAIAVHGVLRDAASLPALVADVGGEPAGLLTYDPGSGPGWEVVTLDAVRRGVGVGSALLGRLAEMARSASQPRLWLITTNDSTDALGFYQRRGWDLIALHRNAVDRARSLKPGIPRLGHGRIRIRHELELELVLT